jgi:hypothetical protein
MSTVAAGAADDEEATGGTGRVAGTALALPFVLAAAPCAGRFRYRRMVGVNGAEKLEASVTT